MTFPAPSSDWEACSNSFSESSFRRPADRPSHEDVNFVTLLPYAPPILAR